ncbi:MAG TPA: hypothetical protein VM366_07075 [Anaerolineae bacterium]|nr:hypothetical protein [Anaerolineae bacterium]
MTDKWETNVGELRLIGGVRQEQPMNLTVAERRPLLPIRSRGKGRLHILVELSGDTLGREELCQDLANAIAEEYFATPGTITYGLRQALLLANAQLLRHNARTMTEHRVGGAACVVLRDGEAFVAQAGWPMVYLIQREQVEAFPETSLDVEDSSVLGQRQVVEVRLFHANVQPGGTILIVDGPMARQLGSTRIGQIVSGNLDRAMLNLETLAPPEDCSALLIQVGAGAQAQGEREQWAFTPVEHPEAREEVAAVSGPRPGGEGGPTREGRIRGQPDRPSERDVQEPAAQEQARQPDAVRRPPTAEQAGLDRSAVTQTRPARTSPQRTSFEQVEVPEYQVSTPPSRSAGPSTRAYQPPASRAAPRAAPGAGTPAEPAGPGIAERASAVFHAVGQSLRTLGERMLPDRPLPSAAERRHAATRKQRREAGRGSRVGIAIAIAIPLVALLIVGGYSVYRDWSTRTQFEAKLDAARLERDIALSNAGSPPQARENWQEVIVLASEADGIQPGTEEIQGLLAQAAAAIDRIDGVTRLASPTKLYDYTAPDSRPTHIIVSGLDAYVLDRGAGQVYHHVLNEVSNALRNPDDSQALMRETQPIDDQTLGMLVDIAWRKDGGNAQRGTLLVLDRNGLLVEFDPSWEQQKLQVLGGKDVWRNPVALETFDANLYLLDPAANQVFKYPDKQFGGAPLTWMQAEGDLSTAIDLGIDGSIYVAHDSGKINKYFGGEPVEFAVREIPKPLLGANALYMDIEEVTQYVYIADASDRRIVQLKRDGTFVRQFRPPAEEEAIFDQLSGLSVDERVGKLYYIAGRALYVNDLPPVPR